jgi:hypothetical protein
VTSHDSGVAPEDEREEESTSPPLKRVTRSQLMDNPNNVSVRNIAKFWEDVTKGEGGGGGLTVGKDNRGGIHTNFLFFFVL